TPALLGVAEREQDLAGADRMRAEHFRPGAGARDLADRGCGLAVLELELGRQSQHAATERDRAGGDHQHVAALAVQLRDVGRERREPGLVEPSRPGIDQERGADLHDDAAEIAERWGFSRHVESALPGNLGRRGALCSAHGAKRAMRTRIARLSRPIRATGRRMSKVWIGTSGWHYDSWRGPFFPKDLRAKDHLRFYAEHFPTTELNGVFYRTPTEEAVRFWRDGTPEHFLFAWKSSKFITHLKRLGWKCDNGIALMESRLKILGRKAGPVLFQLAPNMQADRERLAAFLKILPKRRRYAFEFRHRSWYEEEILDVLRARNVALCLSDHHDAPAPWEVTAS